MSEEELVLARRVVELGVANGVTVGTAESCTGGLVSGALTAISGSSAVVRGGIVSYDPEVKHDVLGVEEDVIADPGRGVVSSDCAGQMCRGAARVLKCDVAVSVTGIAGPTGAEPGKPVGTVWFGLFSGGHVRTVLHHFSGSREEVRSKATSCALTLLREGIEELCLEPSEASEAL